MTKKVELALSAIMESGTFGRMFEGMVSSIAAADLAP